MYVGVGGRSEKHSTVTHMKHCLCVCVTCSVKTRHRTMELTGSPFAGWLCQTAGEMEKESMIES